MAGPTWHSEDVPALPPITRAGWLRAALRGGLLALVTYGCLALLLLLRLLEWPLGRPVSPFIVQFVCRAAFMILGIRHRVTGHPMHGRGALVANHASWLDIFTLNAAARVFFVSKAEVARWPGIGILARATGTVFIARDPRQAQAQTALFEERLAQGDRLLFFPEGTSTDGRRVLGFKSTLFAAFQAPALAGFLRLQPVSVIYHAPPGTDPRFYGWWGEMDFGAHFLRVLAAPRHGSVEVIFHAPVAVADFPSRKALAAHCEAEVRRGVDQAIGDIS